MKMFCTHGSALGRIVAAAGIMLFLANNVAADDDTWVGRTVVLKTDASRIGHTEPNGQHVQVAELMHSAYAVLREENGWLMVSQAAATGWFRKDQALTIVDAIDYFGERLEDNPMDPIALAHRG